MQNKSRPNCKGKGSIEKPSHQQPDFHQSIWLTGWDQINNGNIHTISKKDQYRCHQYDFKGLKNLSGILDTHELRMIKRKYRTLNYNLNILNSHSALKRPCEGLIERSKNIL